MSFGHKTVSQQGMTLIEIVIVIGLMAFVYSIAIPQLTMRTGAETATKLSRLQSDIRAAYDTAVLNRKTYRMVFDMISGDYHLEQSLSEGFVLPDSRYSYDPSEEQEKDFGEAFEQQFKEYHELLGEKVVSEDGSKHVSLTSPVIEAKDDLAPPKWEVLSSLEWGERSIGPNMMITEMQAEHHQQKQVYSELPEKGRVFIYFYPDGKVEKSFLRIAFKKSSTEPDETQIPYLLNVDAFSGTSDLTVSADEATIEKI